LLLLLLLLLFFAVAVVFALFHSARTRRFSEGPGLAAP